MIKTDLVDVVVTEHEGLTRKEVNAILDTALEAIVKALEDGEDVKLAGFGNFVVKTRAARTGKNPATGDTIQIPATKVVGFKPSKTLKERVK